ncbi:hypothetical protein DIPPA_26858 [Diplonema papillatum]|nr:hypothetical protein DIPPA_26858 [Diplonema papillatum]
MEGPDVDRFMGFPNVPVFSPTNKEEWSAYKAQFSGKRNAQMYTEINTSLRVASLPDNGVEKVEAEALFRKWIKVIGVLISAAKEFSQHMTLHRGLKGLPHDVITTYSQSHEGQFVGWAAPSSASQLSGNSTFLGDATDSITFEINGVSRGISMKALSAYPEEEEVLLPPFTGFEVKSVVHPPAVKWTTVQLHVVTYLYWDDPFFHAFLLQVMKDAQDVRRRLSRMALRLLDSEGEEQRENGVVNLSNYNALTLNVESDVSPLFAESRTATADEEAKDSSDYFATMDAVVFTESSQTDRVYTSVGFQLKKGRW